jgi:GxxExxY protein
MEGNAMTELEIRGEIVSSAAEVHRALGGPGLHQEVYAEALAWELASRGFNVECEPTVTVSYKGIQLGTVVKPDLVVDRKVVVEVRNASTCDPMYQVETLAYLRLMKLKLGLVVNFGEAQVQEAIYTVEQVD